MKPDPLKTFGIILPSVARMMDERKLSTSEAMVALRQFVGEGEQPAEVKQAIARLETIEDELELRFRLGQESLLALSWKG